MPIDFAFLYGTEDECPKSPNKVRKNHRADPNTFHLERDGDGVYIDVNCKWCGRSGCCGRFSQKDVDW